MSYPQAEEYLRSAEHHHEQYMRNLRLFHGIQPAPGTPRSPRPASVEWPASPATFLRSSTFSLPAYQPATSDRSRRPTNESPGTRPFLLQDGLPDQSDRSFLPLTSPSSTITPAEASSSCVVELLGKQTFSESDLVRHIKEIPETQTDTITALAEAIQKKDELDPSSFLTSFEYGQENYYKSATYQFYEVNSSEKGGATEQKRSNHVGGSETDGDNWDTSVWSILRQVNTSGNAVGRIS